MVQEQTTFIPVNVITGFLGSGKTTLLQRLLAAPQLADTAVLVNEFGEVGLDHHLLQRLDDEIVLLQSGCLCCTIRGDLSAAMRDLYSKRERGEIVPFRRLVIETTGLADPVPILSTVMTEPVLRHHFRLGNVVTTVDAVNGLTHLERQPESAKQAAVADRIVITKTDIADGMSNARAVPAGWRSSILPLGNWKPHQVLRSIRTYCSPAISMTLKAKPKKFAAGLPLRKRRRVLPRAISIIWTSTGTMPAFMLSVCVSSGRWIGPPSVSGWPCCCTATAATSCE